MLNSKNGSILFVFLVYSQNKPLQISFQQVLSHVYGRVLCSSSNFIDQPLPSAFGESSLIF